MRTSKTGDVPSSGSSSAKIAEDVVREVEAKGRDDSTLPSSSLGFSELKFEEDYYEDNKEIVRPIPGSRITQQGTVNYVGPAEEEEEQLALNNWCKWTGVGIAALTVVWDTYGNIYYLNNLRDNNIKIISCIPVTEKGNYVGLAISAIIPYFIIDLVCNGKYVIYGLQKTANAIASPPWAFIYNNKLRLGVFIPVTFVSMVIAGINGYYTNRDTAGNGSYVFGIAAALSSFLSEGIQTLEKKNHHYSNNMHRFLYYFSNATIIPGIALAATFESYYSVAALASSVNRNLILALCGCTGLTFYRFTQENIFYTLEYVINNLDKCSATVRRISLFLLLNGSVFLPLAIEYTNFSEWYPTNKEFPALPFKPPQPVIEIIGGLRFACNWPVYTYFLYYTIDIFPKIFQAIKDEMMVISNRAKSLGNKLIGCCRKPQETRSPLLRNSMFRSYGTTHGATVPTEVVIPPTGPTLFGADSIARSPRLNPLLTRVGSQPHDHESLYLARTIAMDNFLQQPAQNSRCVIL